MIFDQLQGRSLHFLLRVSVPIVAFLAGGDFAWGQPQDSIRVDTSGVHRHDSLHTDSTHLDSLATQADSSRPSRLVPEHGAPLGSVAPSGTGSGYEFLGKRELVWARYFTAFDALRPQMPAYPLSQGGPGLVEGFSLAGADPASISGLFNGRPLHGAGERGYDLELYPMEFVERVEILRGARALLYGSGESLMSLNFVGPRYDAEGSYVRIWYAQGEHNTTVGDITFARNVGKEMNLSLGFRRLASDGIYRNNNQQVTSWNGRGAIRWTPSEQLSFSLTEIFSDARRGLNGGLSSDSPVSEFFATVNNDSLAENTLRHDVTLSTRYYPALLTRSENDSAGTPVPDTSLRIDGSIYYSYIERALLVDDRSAEIVNATAVEAEDVFGARAGLTIPLAFANLLANGVVELHKSGTLRLEGGGLLEVPAGDVLMIRGGAKVYAEGDEYSLAFVGEGSVQIDSLSLRAMLRQSNALNPPQVDAAGPDTLHYFSSNRTTLYGEAGVEWKKDELRIGVSGIFRRFEPRFGGAGSTIISADARVQIPLPFQLVIDNHLIGSILPEGDRRFPILHGVSDLYGKWRLLKGSLNLRLGTSLEYQSQFDGSEFDVVAGAFYYPEGSPRTLRTLYPLWNAYAQARIGSAYVRIEWRNILNAEFYTLYRYPTWGRGIYLGVNWALID